MCGRYTIKDPVALAQLIAHLTGEPFAIVAARYNICPSQSNPVVRPRPEGKPAAELEKKTEEKPAAEPEKKAVKKPSETSSEKKPE